MNVPTTPLPPAQAMQPDTQAYAVSPVPVSQSPVAVAPATQPATPQAVQEAVSVINQALQATSALEFSIDSDTSRTIVRMVDTTTGETLRQYPSEAVLAISRNIEAFQQGLLLDSKA